MARFDRNIIEAVEGEHHIHQHPHRVAVVRSDDEIAGTCSAAIENQPFLAAGLVAGLAANQERTAEEVDSHVFAHISGSRIEHDDKIAIGILAVGGLDIRLRRNLGVYGRLSCNVADKANGALIISGSGGRRLVIALHEIDRQVHIGGYGERFADERSLGIGLIGSNGDGRPLLACGHGIYGDVSAVLEGAGG